MCAQWYDANISLPGCDKNMPVRPRPVAAGRRWTKSRRHARFCCSACSPVDPPPAHALAPAADRAGGEPSPLSRRAARAPPRRAPSSPWLA